ncbi:hypothetical protein Tcan_01134, partial [Toxocara canis]
MIIDDGMTNQFAVRSIATISVGVPVSCTRIPGRTVIKGHTYRVGQARKMDQAKTRLPQTCARLFACLDSTVANESLKRKHSLTDWRNDHDRGGRRRVVGSLEKFAVETLDGVANKFWNETCMKL